MSDDEQAQGEGGGGEGNNNVASSTDASNEEVSAPANPEQPTMVKWRGHMVTEKESRILKHVFDEMKDHFGNRKCEHPNIRFNCDPSIFLSKHEPYTYRSHPDPTPSDRWHGELDFTYTINDETYNMDYIAIDVSSHVSIVDCFALSSSYIN